jgi:hypothetical protein
MRGTAEWGQPYLVDAGGAELMLAEALAYDEGTAIDEAYLRVGDEVRIRFAAGVLRARIA